MTDSTPAHVGMFFMLLQDDIEATVQHGAESKSLEEIDENARAYAARRLDRPCDHAPPRKHRPLTAEGPSRGGRGPGRPALGPGWGIK